MCEECKKLQIESIKEESPQTGLRSLGLIFFFGSLFIFYIAVALINFTHISILFVYAIPWLIYNIILTKSGIKAAKWLGWILYLVALGITIAMWHSGISENIEMVLPILWFVFNLAHGFIRTPGEKRRKKNLKWTIYWTILGIFIAADLMFAFAHSLLAVIAIWVIDECIDYYIFIKNKKLRI